MRTLALIAATVTVAATASGCIPSQSGSHGSTARPGGANAAIGPAVQIANGPPAATGPGRRPLSVDLARVHDPVALRFHQPPRAGLLFDLDTGKILWRRNPTAVLPIASLTKMMTALVVVDHAPPPAQVLITKLALAYRGSGVGVLPKGKSVKLETLLNGLMLPSGNDAARALAQHVSGRLGDFVALMNARAATMNLQCTHYTSVDGFVDAGNHSCAVDLAAEARAVLDSPRLARIVKRRRAILPFPIKGGRLWLFNNNPLLVTGYPGVLGVKTGYTNAAGHCLVAAARRNGRRLGVVLLHSPNTGDQARKLLDRGFALRS
jgi:serine-type D-Ala-D-Ala carboxypeptidase (penicillin-binding protein 5/6)